ncbi:hypothetical protein LJY25_08030 [Hymenobacter sp. BT175]|uniref:WD40/YVTN/BNR-like repeat-containing protein n=1 Tax=Hymenobacter translucens TaxID=2886507 RepID=UPI001D0E881F|nr:hypothetical protein [Hymenobacter translucens]MCC2546390.1 hypothetical protein [Hymenobacter translucens]
MRFEELKPAASAGKELRAIDFLTVNQGVAGGSNGLLLTTADGGQTWQTLTPNPGLGTINKLVMTSATTIWAATEYGIQHSTNGGQSWQQRAGGTFTDVQFVTSLIGYATAGNGSIIKTTNGGISWFNSFVAQFGAPPLRGVSFSAPDSGMVVGDDQRMLTTTNGGSTWVQKGSQGSGSQRDVLDVLRLRSGSYFVVGTAGIGVPSFGITGFRAVQARPDGTVLETLEAHPRNTFPTNGLAQWQGRVVGVGNGNVIRQHAEFGKEGSPWVQVHGPDGASFQRSYLAADFADANTFYAVSKDGVITRFHY